MKYYIPSNITRDHIIRAIEEVSKNGYDRKRKSTKYDLLHEGRKYPPKVVLTVANKFANGEQLHHSKFSGGIIYANKFLKERGFEIVEKDD